MSQFVEVKTAELIGPALDWAVAEADGLRPYPHKGGFWVLDGKTNAPLPLFSTDWAQGGKLVDEYRPDLMFVPEQKKYGREFAVYLFNNDGDEQEPISGHGQTYLVALCRSIVAAKLGDVVKVPAELVGVAV